MTSPTSQRGRGAPEPFSVVMVCNGNICRSPLAEQLLRGRLDEAGLSDAVAVSSAGLGAVVGAPIDDIPDEISERLRGRSTGSTARQLNSAIVNGADLLLTMTRAQRDDLIHRHPRALQRTFTVTEFTKLLALTGSTGLRPADGVAPTAPPATDAAQVAAVLLERTRSLSRSRSLAKLTADDDIRDPYLQSRAVHEAVGEHISLASTQIAHNFSAWAIDANVGGAWSA